MELELRHVQVVLAVADAGSINRAATRLKIAQAGLTAQLHRIEDGLGGRLFVRRSDGVTLTDLGQHVVRRGRELTEQFDDLLTTAKLIGRQDRPASAMTIQIGGTDEVFVPLLASAVAALLPGRGLATYHENTAEPTLEMLRSRKLDMAVLAACPGVPMASTGDLIVRTLTNEPNQIALSTGHRLAHGAEVKLSELADEAWIVPDDRVDGLRLSLRLACEKSGFSPRFRHFGVESAAAGRLVAGGHAVALCRSADLEQPGLVHRSLAGDPLHVRTLLVWTADSPLAELAEDIHVRLLTIRATTSAED